MKMDHILSIFFLILVGICEAEEDGETQSPLITHLEDETEMRKRLREQAKVKFSHQYHKDPCQVVGIANCRAAQEFPQSYSVKRRRKREITAVILSGIIGMTTKAIAQLTTFQSISSRGGCAWFGTSPFCRQTCPSEYDYIRSSNGRCSNFWLSTTCVPDDSFGEACSTLLGPFFKKRFCCKSDPRECTWAGRWMGANTAHNAYCRYDNDVEPCGQLSCSINHYDYKDMDRAPIEGKQCDQIRLFNLSGIATCGYINWFDAKNDVVNSWYKTGE